ncbi:efflux RND transporter periplasmic adaptor subunit [Allorhodopirellula heiligendammensis]|uniref:Multidrug efflux pump subunit AcrA n=1 Tax=Allorhodopirellula heiligendammensis TaxID=2714739 RepID=A0A5C6BH97_9BACT|nr:efflux RND transporter periplasmic adaptor subunit [Allorhodopirellula heiligendammensis]TWU10649.1 Multidrug efflux pump subunit AcrA precursor [Allorhodopirellula heiligendammensis]
MFQYLSSLAKCHRGNCREVTVLTEVSLTVTLLMLAAVGCKTQDGPPPPPPPPPAVEVATATTRQIIDYREFTGRTSAMESVEIRARVSGYLLRSPRSKPKKNAADSPSPDDRENADWQITAKEGELVKKGAPLFLIDRKPYQLALDQSLGSLKASQARLTQATQDLSRSRELLGRDATSEAEYDQAVAAVAELRGQIENLKATAERNLLDLTYTQVESPIDGLLGSTMVTEGNLVVADTTVLTTVVSTDPIYVDFNVDEQSVLDYRKRIAAGEVKSARDVNIPIRMGLANEEGYPHEGTIDFVDNRTDPNTGNTRIRGVFENSTGILSPGLFSRVQTPFTQAHEAILIPSPAIAMDQQGRYVMVVGSENEVSRRSVTLGQIIEDKTVVTEGLQAGEQVIISGLQKVRPGVTVTIKDPQPQPKMTEDMPSTNSDAPQASEHTDDAAQQSGESI